MTWRWAAMALALASGCDAIPITRPDGGWAETAIVTEPCVPFGRCPAHCPIYPVTDRLPTPDPYRDTWTTFAKGFFENWCVRCHSSMLVGSGPRGGAPAHFDASARDLDAGADAAVDGGLAPNWDVPAAVLFDIALIRQHVGVWNDMPPHPPWPSCEERRRLIVWIDSSPTAP